MEDTTLRWIYILAVTVFAHETRLHVDAYYFNSRCIGTKCVSYIGSKATYSQAEQECRSRWNGHLAYIDFSSGSEQKKLWIHNQMATDGEVEIWMGAKLVNLRSDDLSPECNILRGPDSSSNTVTVDKKGCRESNGVLCMKDISPGCPKGFKKCGQQCFKYLRGRYTWQKAREKCKAQGDGVDMFDHLQVQLQNYYQCYKQPRPGQKAWVKGSEEEVEFSDGRRFEPSTQNTFWQDTEPSMESNKQCISYTKDQGWKMQSCSKTLPFACFHHRNGEDPYGRNPSAPENPMDEMTTAETDVEVFPDSGNTEDDNSNMALMLGIISLSVVVVVSIVVIIVVVIILKRRKKDGSSGSNLEKAAAYGSALSNASSTKYLVEPSAPPADDEKTRDKIISTVSSGTNHYESIDDPKIPSPGYQGLQGCHNEYAHPYTGLDFTDEQNRRNESQSPPESPPVYDDPYTDKRRLPRIGDSQATSPRNQRQKSPGPRHVTFGGIETPLAKVLSNSPKSSRGGTPAKIPRPTVASPRLRPPAALPKSYNNQSTPTGQDILDNSAAYNQSAHSYLELLPEATPEELEAVKQAATAKAKKPRKKEQDSDKKTESEGNNVKQKAKALEGKFKLSTSPTLGRQKLNDGKFPSVVDGCVYKQ